MTFQDIIKDKFLNQFTLNDISTFKILIILGIASLLAIYIFFFYRYINRNNFYSKEFSNSLAIIAIITACIILTISSSIVVSLGMVGALSIVRFRTAIKAPLDLVFLFWSIAIGIMSGAAQFKLVFIGSFIISVLILFLNKIPLTRVPLLLVVQTKDIKLEKHISDLLNAHTKYYKIKSRTFTKDQLNLLVEVKVDSESEFMNNLISLPNISHLSLMSHDGEVTY